MKIFETIIGIGWLIFAVVWLVGALGSKRNLRTVWWQSAWFRIIIGVGIYLILRQQLYASIFSGQSLYVPSLLVGTIGTIFTLLGFALAIWARVYLGTNWGMPMSLKENRELVTTGPYHYIRHPIYAGITLAMIGAALIISPWLLVIIAVYFLYFIFSVRSEQKTLSREFPNEYPAYMKRTKMLIPFIL